MTRGRLAGRVYVVTGAAGGIGAGICQAILEEGGRAALTDIDLDGAARTAGRADPIGAVTAAFRGDVTRAEDVERMVEATVEHFGRLDGAVNNAGAVTLDEAWDATRADWNRQLDVNVTGSFLVARASASGSGREAAVPSSTSPPIAGRSATGTWRRTTLPKPR